MPARRDIMTGRYNFLERNWGPIEAFDYTLPQALRTRGVWSHMVTDHYHYLEIGGENYCQMFDSWIMYRGQEWDPCISRTASIEIPEHYGKMVPQYWYNRAQFADCEENYPSVRTIRDAAQWLEENHAVENFHLWVEPFDPHEPFEVPQKYLDMVGDDYTDKLFMWPEYKPVDEADLSDGALSHIKKRYLALLLMTDHWLGKLLDVMDRHNMWDDTAFIYTSDHGYMLGEHNYMAKNYMPAYNEVFHIPLIVHAPGQTGPQRLDALTQNIDVLPTLMDIHGISRDVCRNPLHGKSWMPLIRGEADHIRDCALYGYFGKQVNLTDGRYTYFRSPNPENRPLALYTTIPTDIRRYFDAERLSDVSKITCGSYLFWTDYPVYKIPADAIADVNENKLRFIYLDPWEQEDQIYDLKHDYEQENNLIKTRPELLKMMEDMMRKALKESDAPEEQYLRLML